MVRLERLNVVYETEDEVWIEELKQMGFEVVGGAAPETKGNAPETVDWNKMTVKELKAYAEENGIDLGSADTKNEIIAAIEGE